MKWEAGVVDHELTGGRDGGLAWIDRDKILALVGANMVQLATLVTSVATCSCIAWERRATNCPAM